MLMAKVVSDLANRTAGKEAVAMESFAKALRMVSMTRCQIKHPLMVLHDFLCWFRYRLGNTTDMRERLRLKH